MAAKPKFRAEITDEGETGEKGLVIWLDTIERRDGSTSCACFN
jgi:hypothetical protein